MHHYRHSSILNHDLLLTNLLYLVILIYEINHLYRLLLQILNTWGYRIAEYKSDLEDKLQTYNKINGAIRRHFGKQMNKETKLRIHNITAKAALKFGSEAWKLRKREEQRLEAAQMKFFETLTGDNKIG